MADDGCQAPQSAVITSLFLGLSKLRRQELFHTNLVKCFCHRKTHSQLSRDPAPYGTPKSREPQGGPSAPLKALPKTCPPNLCSTGHLHSPSPTSSPTTPRSLPQHIRPRVHRRRRAGRTWRQPLLIPVTLDKPPRLSEPQFPNLPHSQRDLRLRNRGGGRLCKSDGLFS